VRQGPDLGRALCNYPLIDGIPQNHPTMTVELAGEGAR
jgi:dipeptide transport system ATP-binding protein